MEILRRLFYHSRKTDTLSQPEAEERYTFLIPFVIVYFLTLPSLVVMAYTRFMASSGLDMLSIVGYLTLVRAAFWLSVPVTVILGLLHLIRGKSGTGRIGVLLMLAVIIGLFIYLMMPVN